MGLRFRRSLTILPGVKINFAKTGVSLSVGKGGSTVNFGSKGTKTTVGIPGTGLSHSTYSKYETSGGDRKAGRHKGGVNFPPLATILMIAIVSVGFYLFKNNKSDLLNFGTGLFQNREDFTEKYPDETLRNKIIKHQIWRGQTEDQLRDSMGEPENVTTKALKTKTREIWKYQKSGKTYKVRVTLEGGIVMAWEKS